MSALRPEGDLPMASAFRPADPVTDGVHANPEAENKAAMSRP
jgi:hypothetical protein